MARKWRFLAACVDPAAVPVATGPSPLQNRATKGAAMADALKYLSLRLRKRLPKSVRRLARLSRHLLTEGQSSPQVPAELIADCRMCASRYDLVAALPRRARIAEVGTDRGAFALHILSACDPAELHLIDLDLSQIEPALRSQPRVVLHNGLSHEVLAGFADASFDWIYIDADHSYAGVRRDADAAAAKVKPGGFLVFNDFAHADPFLGAYGVHRAVVEFATARRWPFAWFAYEPSALYDVALRRPAGELAAGPGA
jgi:predicted O-methyltransferase YrrM